MVYALLRSTSSLLHYSAFDSGVLLDFMGLTRFFPESLNNAPAGRFLSSYQKFFFRSDSTPSQLAPVALILSIFSYFVVSTPLPIPP